MRYREAPYVGRRSPDLRLTLPITFHIQESSGSLRSVLEAGMHVEYEVVVRCGEDGP